MSPLAVKPSDATLLLLAGGLGTRIKSVHPDLPKPMVPVLEQPFIEWVLRYFEGQGIRRTVVALGHLANVAETYLQARRGSSEVVVTHERELLGTGGAVAFAAESAKRSEFF